MNVVKIKKALMEQKNLDLSGNLYCKTQTLFAYNSNKIEGSTTTLEETESIYDTGTILANEEKVIVIKDVTEIKNHFTLFKYMLDNVDEELSIDMIKKFHYILKDGTLTESEKSWFNVGEFKKLKNYEALMEKNEDGKGFEYETRIAIPIQYMNVPVDIEIVNDMPSHLDVRIRDKGISLLVYRQKNYFDPLVFDFNKHTFIRNALSVSSSALFEKVISEQLLSTSVIEDYSPRTFDFQHIKLNKKRVPVRLRYDFSYRKQYSLAGDLIVSPNEVTIYGNKERIDTIHYVTTERVVLTDLTDTTKITVLVEKLPHTRFLPNNVSVFIPVEVFTESSMHIPITVHNVPDNVAVRVIPADVEVLYQVGKSMYNKVNPMDFVISVDYNNVVRSTSRRQILTLEKYPTYLRNVKLGTMEIDCFIEIKD